MNTEGSREGTVFKSVKILYGVIAGILASFVAAIVYALYPFLFGIQLEFLAIGVGFIVGFAISKFSAGRSHILGMVGAGLSLVSCVMGDVLSAIAIYSYQNNVPFFEMIASLNFSTITNILFQIVGIENILFYLIAMLIGYALSASPPFPAIPKTKDDEIQNKKLWQTRFILVGLILFFVLLCLTVSSKCTLCSLILGSSRW